MVDEIFVIFSCNDGLYRGGDCHCTIEVRGKNREDCNNKVREKKWYIGLRNVCPACQRINTARFLRDHGLVY